MTLDALGWDHRLDEAFQPHREQGQSPARVAAEHRGAYAILDGRAERRAAVRGRLRDATVLAGGLPAVGDWVAVADSGGVPMIEAVLPRRTAVTRKTALSEADEQVLAANVDTLFVVSDLAGDLDLRRLERYLATAYESGAQPIVVLTKLDLSPDRTPVVAAESVAIGVPVVAVSNVTGEGLADLDAFLGPAATVALLGSSGVGKSTLVNALAGEQLMETGAVRRDGRGRHTTRHRQLLVLPGGALLVDTPGMRELQLWSGDLDEAFSDVAALAARCRFADCGHASEPGCAVKAALESGVLDRARLASYRKLERELEAVAARADKRVWAARKQRWRQRARETRHARRYGPG
ncbi:MAG: ribosome small subunit-dependent GTPase A [Thermoleophilia bacterium]|nr:ribosome small subunit-dependent GTPase A [Thermoleophilia bacterium]